MTASRTQEPPTPPPSPMFRSIYPPLTPLSETQAHSASISEAKEEEIKQSVAAAANNMNFDSAETPGHQLNTTTWGKVCEMRADHVAHKLFIPVYKEAPVLNEAGAEQGDRELGCEKDENEGKLWQDPKTGLFWATRQE